MTRQQVPNHELSADTARANLLTNGGFEIWQRGAGPFTAGGGYTADRWQAWPASGGTISITKDTTNQSSGASCLAIVVGTAASSGSFAQVLQWAKDLISEAKGRTFTLSMRVRAPVANSVRLNLNDGAIDTLGAYNTGTVYETLSVTWAFPASTSDVMARVRFEAVGTYYIDNAMLVIGDVPTNYAPSHPADDLARCQRYYEALGRNNIGSLTAGGIATAGGQSARVPLRYLNKPSTPAITKVGTWLAVNAGQAGVGAVDVDGCQLYATSTAAGEFYSQNNAAGAYLTIEANP